MDARPPFSAPGEDILTEAEIDWERTKGGKKVEARVLKVNVLADKLKQKSRNAPDAVSFFRGGYC